MARNANKVSIVPEVVVVEDLESSNVEAVVKMEFIEPAADEPEE